MVQQIQHFPPPETADTTGLVLAGGQGSRMGSTDKGLQTLHGLPLYVAIEEKLFERAGLAVEATKIENPNQIIDSLVSGRADSAPPRPATC